MVQHDFLIVGGGVAGLSTAWHLARAGEGRSVLLVEREAQLASQSSALNAAILRCLGGDPLSTRIALESARFLREPPAGFSDVPLVDRRGLVLVADADAADRLRRQVEGSGVDVGAERLSTSDLGRLVPAYEGEAALAYRFPDEGQIDIAALVAGFARGARAGGVELRRGCAAESLLSEGGRVVGVRLSSGEELRADRTVIAAGGWAGALGRAAGSRVALRPTRRHLLITRPQPGVDKRWPVLWKLGRSEFYCRPESGGMLLCACDLTDVDPDRCGRDSEVLDEIATKTALHLPSVSMAGAGHFWCGLRTLTADDRFAIGPDPDVAGLFWVAGLAGSGMVCSAEVGRIASSLLLGLPLDPEVASGLHPGRLRSPAP